MRRGVIGAATAAVVAGAIVVLFVLPAEYGVDPTGFGEATGLTALSQTGVSPELARGLRRKGVFTPTGEAMRTDRWEIELEPFQGIEFKYALAEGAPMIFAWRGSAKLHYDMHSHPFEGGTDLTESYGVGDAQSMQGLYVAPFTGIHGWYWQNRTLEPVKLTLDAAGAFTEATVFDQFGEHKRAIAPVK